MRVSGRILNFHRNSLNFVLSRVENIVLYESVSGLGSEPLQVDGGVVSTGQVGHQGTGWPRDVRHQGELLARRSFVLPSEGFQPEPVIAIRY